MEDERIIEEVIYAPFRVMKVIIICLLVLTLLFAFNMVYVNTLVEIGTSKALSDAKLSYDSGYYEPIVKKVIGNVITVKGLTMEGEPITKDNFPRYGDLMKVEVTTEKRSYNLFDRKPKVFKYTTTLVNRGTFGEGYKYERKGE